MTDEVVDTDQGANTITTMVNSYCVPLCTNRASEKAKKIFISIRIPKNKNC